MTRSSTNNLLRDRITCVILFDKGRTLTMQYHITEKEQNELDHLVDWIHAHGNEHNLPPVWQILQSIKFDERRRTRYNSSVERLRADRERYLDLLVLLRYLCLPYYTVPKIWKNLPDPRQDIVPNDVTPTIDPATHALSHDFV
jgi:hypothetical protein